MTALDIAFWFTACLVAVCIAVLAVDWVIRLFNRWLDHRERQARRIRNKALRRGRRSAFRINPMFDRDWK